MKQGKHIAYMGIFLALALILSYVESLIPFAVGIPGVKLGLCNLLVVLMLYLLGWREALTVSVLRILLAGILFGNAFSILYSLSGGILSFLVMLFLKKTDRFHVVTVSIFGGVFHNLGQIFVAALILESYYVIYYVSVLVAAGAITGALIGILSAELGKRLAPMIRKEWEK
ncbi:MAG: Gx transporter family protein [Roseburia sp.]